MKKRRFHSLHVERLRDKLVVICQCPRKFPFFGNIFASGTSIYVLSKTFKLVGCGTDFFGISAIMWKNKSISV
jgi:hypothetical protein